MLRSLLLKSKPGPPLFVLRERSICTDTSVCELASLLSSCAKPYQIYQVHAFMVTRGLDRDNLLLSRFILACSSLGLSSYSYSVFAHKINPDIYLYNTIIKALSLSVYPLYAVFLYNKIQLGNLRPDTYSFPFVLKAVVRLSAIHVGLQIHCQIVATGLDSDVNVATSLIQMYSCCGRISDARKVFDDVTFRDVVLWNAMVAGYVKVGEVDEARHLFDSMPVRNVISWTALISGYAQTNRPNEAIALFRRMQLADVKPDEIAMLAVLSACAHLGALELGEWIHNYIEKHGVCRIVPLNNALIDMYAKSGNVTKALEVFENMTQRSIITWTTMIAALALHGLGREALEMFARMEREGVRPNEITFIAILSACSHVGMVEMGRWYFEIMVSRYGIEPTIEHFGCIIDLLARAGYLKEAQEIVRKMPFEANAAIWGSLLAASNIHSDADLAEQALKHLARLEPHNSGNYTLLCNTYSALGRWDESGMMRKVMRDTGVKKMPGGSSIEVNNIVYEFIAGGESNLHFAGIHQVLRKINEQLGSECLENECSGLLEFEE